MAITAIKLPAGNYHLTAKTVLAFTAGSGSIDYRCAINGDPAVSSASDDSAVVEMGSYRGFATLALDLTVSYAAPTTVVLRCRGFNSQDWEYGGGTAGQRTVVARETKIVASPVASVNRVAGTVGATGS